MHIYYVLVLPNYIIVHTVVAAASCIACNGCCYKLSTCVFVLSPILFIALLWLVWACLNLWNCPLWDNKALLNWMHTDPLGNAMKGSLDSLGLGGSSSSSGSCNITLWRQRQAWGIRASQCYVFIKRKSDKILITSIPGYYFLSGLNPRTMSAGERF